MVPTDSLMAIAPSETVGSALRLLNRGIYRHIPVVDPATKSPLGTLKLRDLLQPISSHRGYEPAYARFGSGAIRDDPSGEEHDDESDGGSNTVWGEIQVRDVLRAKRAKRGVDVADTAALATYHKEKAALHTVEDTVSVADAAMTLVARRLTFMIVVGAGGAVRGIVSERHIINAIVDSLAAGAHSDDPAATGTSVDEGVSAADLLASAMMAAPVSEIMTSTSEMLSVRTDQRADRCLALMIGSGLRHLPVLGGPDGSVLGGILSVRDLAEPLVPDEDGNVPGAAAGGEGSPSQKPWWMPPVW